MILPSLAATAQTRLAHVSGLFTGGTVCACLPAGATASKASGQSAWRREASEEVHVVPGQSQFLFRRNKLQFRCPAGSGPTSPPLPARTGLHTENDVFLPQRPEPCGSGVLAGSETLGITDFESPPEEAATWSAADRSRTSDLLDLKDVELTVQLEGLTSVFGAPARHHLTGIITTGEWENNENYCLGFRWDNGKENGSYHIRTGKFSVYTRIMEKQWKLRFSVIPLQYIPFLPAGNQYVLGSCLT